VQPIQSIKGIETVDIDIKNRALVIIDQTQLPNHVEVLHLTGQNEIRDAIYLLKVRGAPAIGVAAAIGVYLAALDLYTADYPSFSRDFRKAKEYLASARPTAVNLFWALDRMEQVVLNHPALPVPGICDLLLAEVLAIRDEDIAVCRKIGEFGLSLLKPGDGILTHCNAGRLATVRYGTATAPIYLGHERGYSFRVFADETRPLLQGARLTAFELADAGIDVTLICDNMSAAVMRQGWVDAVFVGCDRVAANGDTANKIGTAVLAAVSARYHVPFYVCAPTSTLDMDSPDGESIAIEERPSFEVTDMWYKEPMTAPGVKVYNPAFDVTDHDLITGIITEYGIASPPFSESLRKIMEQKECAPQQSIDRNSHEGDI